MHKVYLILKRKKMLSLTKEELKANYDARVCYICGKKIFKSLLMIKIVQKLETIVIIQVNIEVCMKL